MTTKTMPPKSILITSASGNIGRELIPLLLSTTQSTTLVLPTSSASRLQSAFAPNLDNSRLVITEGAIANPVWLETTCKTHAVETVFLNLGGQDELFTTLGALDAFARAGVKHVIYLSCAGEFTSPEGAAAFLRAYGSASVVVKIAVEQRLWYGGYPFKWTVVGPTLFFENDVRTPEILVKEGFMPEPLGERGVSRVSCKDVARVVAKGVEDGGARLGGRKVNVGSWRRYTGSETEEMWTRALGRDVRMGKGDEEGLQAYEEHWAEVIPCTAGRSVGRDLQNMCRGWVENGYGPSEDEYRLLRAVLGKETDDYAEWVAETGKQLREQSK
jgi:nucleoside-diphosphate-sugar epimerase